MHGASFSRAIRRVGEKQVPRELVSTVPTAPPLYPSAPPGGGHPRHRHINDAVAHGLHGTARSVHSLTALDARRQHAHQHENLMNVEAVSIPPPVIYVAIGIGFVLNYLWPISPLSGS